MTAGGAEYAERVHKLGAGFMARLLSLKRFAHRLIERARAMDQYIRGEIMERYIDGCIGR